LRRLTALSHFSLGQLERLAAATQLIHLKSGQELMRRSEESAWLYGISSGNVALRRETLHGELVLARLGPGDLVGEANFVDPGPRASDVMTTTESHLVMIDNEQLRDLCVDDQRFESAVYWAIWNSLSRRLRIAVGMLGHFFTADGATESRSSVSAPSEGEELAVDIRVKRDFFLQQNLSHLEANFLASLSKGRRFGAGETIFCQSDIGEELYFILNGQVRISKTIPGAGEEAIAILDRGEVFGEMALIDRRPRTADAVAHEGELELLSIPASVLSGILDMDKLSSPRLLKLLCRTVVRRMRMLDEKIVGWFLLSGGESTVIASS
jgi:CRP-like cAMP-binding protein